MASAGTERGACTESPQRARGNPADPRASCRETPGGNGGETSAGRARSARAQGFWGVGNLPENPARNRRERSRAEGSRFRGRTWEQARSGPCAKVVKG